MSQHNLWAASEILRVLELESYRRADDAIRLDANYHQYNWGSMLHGASRFRQYCGIKAFFIEDDLKALKQNFYLAARLFSSDYFMQREGGEHPYIFPIFMNGLLSDSPQVYESLAYFERNCSADPRSPRYRYYQFQLILRRDDNMLRESVDLVIRKGRKADREEAKSGRDFCSLLLDRNTEALKSLIDNHTKRKYYDDSLVNEFLAGLAVMEAKLCWYRGIEVQIDHPRVPMALLPIRPLPEYDPVYDCLRPGWEPPPPPPPPSKSKLLVDKVTRGLKQFVRTGTFG